MMQAVEIDHEISRAAGERQRLATRGQEIALPGVGSGAAELSRLWLETDRPGAGTTQPAQEIAAAGADLDDPPTVEHHGLAQHVGVPSGLRIGHE